MKLHQLALAVLAFSGAAQAVTITAAPGAPDPGPGMGEVVVVDFDAPNAVGYTFSGGLFTSCASISGAAMPAGGSSCFGYVSSAKSPNSTTLDTPDLKSISFYWGSIDTYNSVEVLLASGPSQTFTGSMVPMSPANGNQAIALTNQRVTFTAGAGEVITGLVFKSTGVAFEFDTIAAAPIPEPGTWALMAAGLGAVGFVARRRKTQAA
jgi:hypothetical protein